MMENTIHPTVNRLTCLGDATFEKIKVTGHAVVPNPASSDSATPRSYVDGGRCVAGPGLRKQGNVMSVDERLDHVRTLGALEELHVTRNVTATDISCTNRVTAARLVCEQTIVADAMSAATSDITSEARINKLLVGPSPTQEGGRLRASRLWFSQHGAKGVSPRYGTVRLGSAVTVAPSGGPETDPSVSLVVTGNSRLLGRTRVGLKSVATTHGDVAGDSAVALSLIMSDDPFVGKIKIFTCHDSRCETILVGVNQGTEGPPLLYSEQGDTALLGATGPARSSVKLVLRNPTETPFTFHAEAKMTIADITSFSVAEELAN